MELPTLKLKELEQLAIKEAMAQTNNRVAKAARLLGIGRATLYRRLGQTKAQRSEVADVT